MHVLGFLFQLIIFKPIFARLFDLIFLICVSVCECALVRSEGTVSRCALAARLARLAHFFELETICCEFCIIHLWFCS